MLPYILIAVAAILGLFVWGLKGCVFGAILGYMASFLLGLVLNLLSGGLLPRKVRRQTAMNFIAAYPDLVRVVYPGLKETGLLRAVERGIESIFKKATVDNKSMNLNLADTRGAIQAATASLVDQERRPKMRELLWLLEQQIERDLYK